MNKHRWGGPTYSSHADSLKYDAMYREFWNVIGEHIPSKGTVHMARSAVDHNNRELDQIGVLWVNQSRSGKTYLNGYLEDGRKIVAFESQFRGQGSSPDYTVSVAQYTDAERQTLAAEQQARKAQSQAQQPAQATQAQTPVQPAVPIQVPIGVPGTAAPVNVPPAQPQPVQQQPAQPVAPAPTDNLPL